MNDDGPVRLPRNPAMGRVTCDHFALRGEVRDGQQGYVCCYCGAWLDSKRKPLARGVIRWPHDSEGAAVEGG